MIRLYRAETLWAVEHLRAVLAGEGIASAVRNRFLSGAIGELPAFDCWPELWLLDESQLQRARELIDQALSPAADDAEDWNCGVCGEANTAAFEVCWRCGDERPRPSAAAARAP